jgi:hypothetical protein
MATAIDTTISVLMVTSDPSARNQIDHKGQIPRHGADSGKIGACASHPDV